MKDNLRLTASDLACRRGGRLLFEKLSFFLEPGAALALTGPNGAGKTSLLRILAGLLAQESGSVAIDGTGEDVDGGRHMHFCGPRDALKASMTPREMLGFWRAFAGHPASEETIEAALDALAAEAIADIPCGYLSSGQRKRAALARLLVDPRPVWLLDEPTNALDTASQERLDRLVATHLSGGGLVVVATHVALGWPNLRELAIGDYRPRAAEAVEEAA